MPVVRKDPLIILFIFLVSNPVFSADLSDPLNLVFVADKSAQLIDVVNTAEAEVVHRIRTQFIVDAMAVTPYAPLLFYADLETRVLISYNLERKQVDSQVELLMSPRHLVIDPSGKYLGITDSEAGGLVIFSTYAQKIVYEDSEFPPTKDLLFDADETTIYYTNDRTGSLGVFDLTLESSVEIGLLEEAERSLSPPSRSLDGRHIYVADSITGDVFSLNAYSGVVYKTYNVGDSPARPYTTPEGAYLYILDSASGRFLSVEQMGFTTQTDQLLSSGLNLLVVGRFDRLTLILGSETNTYHVYDNLIRKVVLKSAFIARPFDASGSVDGKHAWIAFSEIPSVAMFNFETKAVSYIRVTENGAGAFAVGGTNNVCH